MNCLLNAKLPKCYIIAHRQPRSASERLSANALVIIITPLWFNELVSLWLTHLSGRIRTVWSEGLPVIRCKLTDPQHAYVKLYLESFIHLPHAGPLRAFLHFWQQVISRPSVRCVCARPPHCKQKLATCSLDRQWNNVCKRASGTLMCVTVMFVTSCWDICIQTIEWGTFSGYRQI